MRTPRTARRGFLADGPGAFDERARCLLEPEQLVKHEAVHAARRNRIDCRQRIADVAYGHGPEFTRFTGASQRSAK